MLKKDRKDRAMNAYEIMGLIHILAASMSMISIAIMLIIRIQKIISFTFVNCLLLILAVFNMAISGMYFIIDYYSTITGISGCSAAVRVLDAWIAVSIQFAWFFLLKEILLTKEKRFLWIVIKGIYAALLVVNLVNYGILMDENYYVNDNTMRTFSLVCELAETFIVIALNLFFIWRIMRLYGKDAKGNDVKRFSVMGSALMIAEYIQGADVGVKLISGATVLQKYNPDIINITPVIRGCFAVLLLWYIVKYCGLAQYQKPPEIVMEDSAHFNDEDRIGYVAKKGGLTERETVIVRLLYEGSTYQGIAEYLHLSINTVKHHVTNIYRKLEIGSKMELINMVRTINLR